MCNEAPLEDAEIKELCQSINSSQQSEIDQMKAILKRLEGSQRGSFERRNVRLGSEADIPAAMNLVR